MPEDVSFSEFPSPWPGHFNTPPFIPEEQGSPASPQKKSHKMKQNHSYIYFLNLFLFLAVLGLRCCVWAFLQLQRAGATLRCSARASHCGGFTCCGARALGAQASVAVARGISSCGSWALECRLSSCDARAQLLCGMWDLPGPGLEPVSPASAGRFLTTVPPEKSLFIHFSFT